MSSTSKKCTKLAQWLTIDDIFPEENPTSAEQGSEPEQEADEEPNPGPSNSEAAVGEGVSSELAIRDGVHPIV